MVSSSFLTISIQLTILLAQTKKTKGKRKMKVKELVELLEASIFVCACITDIDCETLEEKEFEDMMNEVRSKRFDNWEN